MQAPPSTGSCLLSLASRVCTRKTNAVLTFSGHSSTGPYRTGGVRGNVSEALCTAQNRTSLERNPHQPLTSREWDALPLPGRQASACSHSHCSRLTHLWLSPAPSTEQGLSKCLLNDLMSLWPRKSRSCLYSAFYCIRSLLCINSFPSLHGLCKYSVS